MRLLGIVSILFVSLSCMYNVETHPPNKYTQDIFLDKEKDIIAKVTSVDIYWVSAAIDTSFVDWLETLNDSRKIKSMHGEEAIRFLETAQKSDSQYLGINKYFEEDTFHVKFYIKGEPEYGYFIINRCIRRGHVSTVVKYIDFVAETHSHYNDEMYNILTDITKEYIKESALRERN